MEKHPIESLMQTAMESIREMVDVNTVVGDPVETPDGTIIIPISRVAVGFAAGGGEYKVTQETSERAQPFGGGSGAGVSVQPMGFLIVGQGQVRLLPVGANVVADRLIDLLPSALERLDNYLGKKKQQEQ